MPTKGKLYPLALLCLVGSLSAGIAPQAGSGGALQTSPLVQIADPEALFYAVPASTSTLSFRAHADSIGVIAPQSFALDRMGQLKGSLPADIAEIAREHHVAIMPLVINADFSSSSAAKLLKSESACDQAIGSLVLAAENLSLAGWQLDFENMPSSLRSYYSRFVSELGASLHQHGKQLSVAVAARTDEDPTTDGWRTFSGVYDYVALGGSADFLSVMAYPESDNEHPGPLAGYPWVEQVIQHVLEMVPADRVSLGLPTYQTDWTTRRQRVTVTEKVGAKLKSVAHYVYRLVGHSGAAVDAGNTDLQWDPVTRSSYRDIGEGSKRHVSWVEDARSFAAKLELVSQYHLRGFSVWRIGLEDPEIWTELPSVSRASATPAPTGNDAMQLRPVIAHP